jgi:two-component system, NtrC family, nitrogen regulation sensor histidine kinase GlnL
MSWRTLPQSLGVDVLALKAAAFELSPDPAMVVDEAGALVAVNEAAEALFGQAMGLLARGRLSAALPAGSALVSLLDRAVEEQAKVRERGVQISLFGLAPFEADAAAAPLGDGSVLLTLSVKGGLGVERGAGEAAGGLRSIVGLGRMLAHEIKNPLAGIRGAAQLLKSGAKAEDAPLAQLIVDETDRVRRLVDRMEAFSEDAVPSLTPVNIHEVLDRVRALAANGVADGLALREQYDPSLPPVLGEEDQLIQIFLNLVKNAAEAAPAQGGEIQLATSYQHGVRMMVAGSDSRVHLPLVVTVTDNGDGIPEDIQPHLFDPFVSTKHNGTGLGLALVAKVIGDHGGVIEFDSQPRRTVFRVYLPVAPAVVVPLGENPS